MKLVFLKKYFSKYNIIISEDGYHATICNPFSNEHIKVEYFPDDDFSPYIAYFSFQHCHLMDEENVIEWISEIIDCKRCAIEFFRNHTNCFGGDIEASILENLSYEALEQYTGYYGIHKLYQLADSFKVRGWDSKNNFDGVFLKNNDASISLNITPMK